MEVMPLAPLIYSKFWNYQNNALIDLIRINLKLLLAYHGQLSPKKTSAKAKKNVSVEIA